jgi:hypothetical protein
MNSKLVFGWEITSKLTNVDLDKRHLLGPGIFWVCLNPYLNAPSDDRRYFISLLDKNEYTFEDLSFLSFTRVVQAKEIVEKTFGIKVGEPKIMSINHE